MQAPRVLGINGGRMPAFVDPRPLSPVLSNYEAPGIVWLYIGGIYLNKETRLFDAVVGFPAIRTVRMLRHRLGQNISFESSDLELSTRHS